MQSHLFSINDINHFYHEHQSLNKVEKPLCLHQKCCTFRSLFLMWRACSGMLSVCRRCWDRKWSRLTFWCWKEPQWQRRGRKPCRSSPGWSLVLTCWQDAPGNSRSWYSVMFVFVSVGTVDNLLAMSNKEAAGSSKYWKLSLWDLCLNMSRHIKVFIFYVTWKRYKF